MQKRIERLDEYLKAKGVTPNQAERLCSIANGTLSKARMGKSDIGIKTIEKLMNVFSDLDRIWLITGNGKMLKDSVLTEQINVHGNNEVSVRDDDRALSNIRIENEKLKTEVQQLRERLQKLEELNDKLLNALTANK